MRNINELIGIIKGISFDGVINNKEIEHLQSWVDKNRNLVYEPRQIELIKMVDDVLEDHVIDEEEKKSMLEKAENFLKDAEDNTANVYELNGIIEGIICDGEVNKAEVYRLKEWMNMYGDNIRNQKPSVELCKAIDDILDDGVVTEQEQSMLLHMLSDRINNSQFETKLDYLCKLVRGRKNIGTDLIDILDNDIAMKEIHKRAEIQLMNGLSSYSGCIPNQEIIVVSLVLIAMLEYDGNYYGNVRNTYTNVYRKYSEQKVEGMIRSILGRYKKQKEDGSRSRIINVVLENAIVPQAFLPAFFEFIFDIYKLNFECDLPEDLYEEFEFVFEGLRNNLLCDGDDISVNITQKTYKLIATTKQLITREDGLDAIIKLSILIVKLIDKCFWDKEVRIFNPYLKAGYEGWEKQLKNAYKCGYERRKNTSEMRSRWEPKYMMIKNAVCLIPPIHKVKAQYNYKDIAVVILNENVEIYRNNSCDIREIIGGYQVDSGKIALERPLGKLKYQLVAGNEVIYDSKDKLFRNYIVFNEEGQEVNNNTDFEGTVYCCYKEGDAELEDIIEREYYRIGYKLIRIGDAIGIGHDVFNFSSMIKPGVFGQIYSNCKVKFNNNDMLVYKEAKVVVFEANDSAGKFEIVINGKSHKLADMKYKVTERGTIAKYVVELGLESSGIYTVEVNQLHGGKKDRILKELFAYDAELSYKMETINDHTYRVWVSSELLNEIIDEEIAVDEFQCDFIQFKMDGNVFNYIIPFDFGIYKLSDDIWHSAKEELWIDDIKMDTTLTLYDSKCDGALVYTEDGKLAEDDIVLQARGYYKQLPVGFLNSYKNGNTHILLVFTAEGKARYTIPCYNKCVMEEDGTEILFLDSPKNVLITPSFHGKNKVFFEVLNTDGESIYKSSPLSSGQTESFDKFKSFEEYTINFYEKTKNLQLKKSTLLLQIHKTFYVKEDFIGRAFKINDVYFNQSVKGEFSEKSYHFNKAYVCLTDVIGNGIFRGEIFVKTMQGEWYLEGINPVEVEMCSDVVDDTMDIYITNEGDGLLLDFEKHGILNALEHPTAPDIFLYTISTKAC
ncbi:MAG: hypothetical protein NC393_06755 [Clostridium sp.]|nr:hypothetical protein [Clostridium sp.]MCM1171813.1 hypothetical protein [Clostridium sp.]MCM1235680.1 hypothetical protein [Ruminococcus flavefaciens]